MIYHQKLYICIQMRNIVQSPNYVDVQNVPNVIEHMQAVRK